jgi:hypothetical protein
VFAINFTAGELMRNFVVLALFCLLASSGSYAQDGAAWKLSRDVSLSQGAGGTWYFMESEAPVHDPSRYKLLPDYQFPCPGPYPNNSAVLPGVGCWLGTASIYSVNPDLRIRTQIALNFADQLVGYSEGASEEGYLPRTLRLTANAEHFAIVAWRSPLTGFVKVSAKLGERWSVFVIADYRWWYFDINGRTLKSGVLEYEPTATVNFSRLQVTKGDVLYFIVDASRSVDPFLDLGVDVSVTISPVN